MKKILVASVILILILIAFSTGLSDTIARYPPPPAPASFHASARSSYRSIVSLTTLLFISGNIATWASNDAL